MQWYNEEINAGRWALRAAVREIQEFTEVSDLEALRLIKAIIAVEGMPAEAFGTDREIWDKVRKKLSCPWLL